MTAAKRALRTAGRRVFAGDAAGRADASRRIREQLVAWAPFRNAPRVALFASLAWEPDVLPLLDILGERATFPRADAVAIRLTFYRVARAADLVPGAYGIPEPPATAAARVDDWGPDDLVLVPGSVFDARGYRVGGGLGFYDRFLAQCPARTCGVAFAGQIVAHVPDDPWDVPVRSLLTESGFLR